ncbi:N-acetylmuramic acid 6-phosphate etherase [Mycoplasmopsis alligatoris]|uniref:Putative N-acetylmuramic acid 6-phosphate etherase n=1 Tax=Mycoplasmopsis alligatoris A21JP2 TaxID=747682 RepID=D4XX46_9BACT|nr:N-acetylmuramic acid 6-phosphate etherase [Mycoplasmopsis alligatoris]EFF41080.1 putative N-acetylmuramic acid 6-phosphate etherase [Mycoplasmopsis alligatoris A21JP2]
MKELDKLSTLELVEIFNGSTYDVIKALEASKHVQTQIINQAVKSINKGGSVIYIGAGTSGRIALLDALDVETTFGEKDWFKYQISGGDKSVLSSNEGTEDDYNLALKELKKFKITKNDFIIGASSSGSTRYILGGIEYAKKLGAKSALITSKKNSVIGKITDYELVLETGEELIAGSSRLKAASALKIVLNNISSISAIKLGKVYNDLMVGLKPNNDKTYNRCIEMICKISHCNLNEAKSCFDLADQNVIYAIIMKVKNLSLQKAKELYLGSRSSCCAYGSLRRIIG